MVTNWKTRPVGSYVTLLGLKTENKTQSKVASSPLPNDSVFAFRSFRLVSFSRLAGCGVSRFCSQNTQVQCEVKKMFQDSRFFKTHKQESIKQAKKTAWPTTKLVFASGSSNLCILPCDMSRLLPSMDQSQLIFLDSSEDRGRILLRNLGKYLSIYTASCPGRLENLSTPPSEPQSLISVVLHALPMSFVMIPSVKRR